MGNVVFPLQTQNVANFCYSNSKQVKFTHRLALYHEDWVFVSFQFFLAKFQIDFQFERNNGFKQKESFAFGTSILTVAHIQFVQPIHSIVNAQIFIIIIEVVANLIEKCKQTNKQQQSHCSTNAKANTHSHLCRSEYFMQCTLRTIDNFSFPEHSRINKQ